MTAVSRDSAPLPPMPCIAAALRLTTERLANELANGGARSPAWSPFEWRTGRAVAAMHGISGLLADVLPWSGPEGWTEFLVQQHENIAQRHVRTFELLASIHESFQRAGIPVQALKGAALYAEGLYRPGQRPMADLDLLTSPKNAMRAGAVLERLGLRHTHDTLKHRVFESTETTRPPSFGEHGDHPLKVELHERICEPLPHQLTDISSLLTSSDASPGLNPYRCRAALMVHLLLHAAGGMAYRTLRMIQLHDITLLAYRMTPQDWHQLLAWRPWWAWPPLALARMYYPRAPLESVMDELHELCPVFLRRTCARQLLSDVSLSRLWLEAFPGIEWARSPRQAVVFMARRIVPAPQVRSDRHYALATDPSLMHGDWGGLSQGRRILRALCAPTPRPWPLYNVREALAQNN